VAWGIPWISYGTDLGLFLGWGVEKQSFGFRKLPFASRQILRGGYAFGDKNGKLEYTGEFRRENRDSYWGIHAFASGVEVLRYYGLGNETPDYGGSDSSKVDADEIVFYPSYTAAFGKRTSFTLGPALKYWRTVTSSSSILDIEAPYGVGKFGEVGLHGVLTFDSRDSQSFPRHGLFLGARGSVAPALWDVEETFGQVNGNADVYLSSGSRLTLALRGGGKRVFGTYPFNEAAYIGGGALGVVALREPEYTVRGFHSQRFAGDASLWGNAELRLGLTKLTLILPAHWGIFGFEDAGRVWLDGENSDLWHTGVGGGIWISYLNYRGTASAGIAHSTESDLFYFRGGFTF
jgi:outer membrane protein assembly factor BamA